MHCPSESQDNALYLLWWTGQHIYCYKGHSFCQTFFIPQLDRLPSEDYNFRQHCTFQMMLNTEIIKRYVGRAQAHPWGSSRVKGSPGKTQTGCGNRKRYSEKVRVLEDVQKVERWQPTLVSQSGEMHKTRQSFPNNTPTHCRCWQERRIRSYSWGKHLP